MTVEITFCDYMKDTDLQCPQLLWKTARERRQTVKSHTEADRAGS